MVRAALTTILTLATALAHASLLHSWVGAPLLKRHTPLTALFRYTLRAQDTGLSTRATPFIFS